MIKCNLENSCPKNFDHCCFSCREVKADFYNACDSKCEDSPHVCGDSVLDEAETALAEFQQGQITVLNKIAKIVTTKKALEDQEKQLKEKLQEAMEAHSVKKFESDVLNITYVAASTSTSIDSKKLKKKYPNIAEECSKTSNRKAYVKVSVK